MEDLGVDSVRTLSLVVPTFNEEANLPRLFEAIDKLGTTLLEMNVSLEVVIVDNFSADATWRELQIWGARTAGICVVLAQHPVNLGMQQSLLTGVRLSTGDAIAVMQSDLQDPPDVIVEMVREWNDGALFVATQIESRRGSVIPRVGAWFFYRALSLVSDSKIIPDSSDFYLIDSKFRKSILKESGSTPFLRATLSSLLSPDAVISYKRLDREGGTTNFNLRRRVNFALDALLRDLGGLVKRVILAAAVIGGGAFLGLATLTVFFLFGYRSPVAGWLSTTGIALVLLSTTMTIGALSLELLYRIYRDIPRHDMSRDSEIVRFENR